MQALAEEVGQVQGWQGGLMSETDEDESGGWDGYSSQFMFPAEGTECTCDHETVEHGYSGCDAGECPCDAYWEHT
jgi:hypothetical protein